MAHTVQIKETINGVEITETIDGNVVVKLISHQSKPFIRTTNETDEETYQIIDKVGEIYNIPAIATDFVIIDVNGAVFIPADGLELIAYSYKIRAFRPDDESDIFHIGTIDTTSNSVTINLAGDGINWARISGSFYEKYYPDTFNFTPVTTGQKILIIYAKPDAQVFHLAQGAESTEAVEPAYSGLFVARLLVTDEGIDIVEAVSGFREKSVDNFAIYSLVSGDRILGIGSQMRLKVQSLGAIRIGGFYNEEGKVYNGCPISVRNDTPFPMEFYNAVDVSPEFMPINPDDLPFSIKPGETANFAWRGNVAEIIKTGGAGDLTLEQARQNGNVLQGNVEIEDTTINYSTIDIFRTTNSSRKRGIRFYDDEMIVVGMFPNDWAGGTLIVGNEASLTYTDDNGTFSTLEVHPESIKIYSNWEDSKGITSNTEFNKQGDRKAFAQLSDVYDAITTETNARIAADKIETVVIALSPFNEDLLDNISRLGLGVLTFPLKVLSFQTSAFPVPTGSGITTDLRKNGTSVATSVISAGATNSTGNPPPTFSADTFAIGDRLNFFTPTGGVGSTVKGQNLVATLIIQRL